MKKVKTDVNRILSDGKAVWNFLCERGIRRSGEKKRVAFLCQYIPAWNKMQPVYEALKRDPRFEAFLICVPSGIRDQKLLDPESEKNDIYDYFVQRGYDALNALTGRNRWMDLEGMKLDYIFYSRPYNSYMPKPYTSNHVSRYSKICCLIYGMSMTKPVMEEVLNRDFFRNVYCYFAESAYARKVNQSHLLFTHKMRLQKSVYYGMPALAQILEAKNGISNAWNFSKHGFKVMWTPRWITDPMLGGTNFFLYKDILLQFAEEHNDIDLLLRPHPLMFDNFLKTGEMSAEDIAVYRNRVEALPNASFDSEPEYGATFWQSSVLISDISGILPEYFITGKPLIYCASNMILELTDMTKRMLEGCYVVNTPRELFDCLKELKDGKDILAERRGKIAYELFGDSTKASQRIVEELAKG